MYNNYDSILEALQYLDENVNNKDIKLVDRYNTDISIFLCQIMAADKRFSKDEIDYYNNTCNSDFGKKDIIDYMKRYNIVSCPHNYPDVLEDLDKLLLAQRYLKENEMADNICETMDHIVNYFIELGLEFLASDSKFTGKETKVYSDYVSGTKALCDRFIDELNSLDDDEDEADIAAEPTLEELLEELNSLIGLAEVKSEINATINLVRVRKLREDRGFTNMPMSFHMAFLGNPGTGKTTVARLLSKIYKCLGVLSKGHLVEVDRSDLVAGYIGQTAIKTKEAIEGALGGILFIDEAYSLAHGKCDNDYGIEAIDTIVKFMEDNRNDLIVVVAGYPYEMDSFINSNPGLKSRFSKYIDFNDYSPNELIEIFKSIVEKNNYIASEGAINKLVEFFNSIDKENMSEFGNARGVRNIFEACVTNQACRIASMTDVDDDTLITIEAEDIY